jgi:hypothetical protein
MICSYPLNEREARLAVHMLTKLDSSSAPHADLACEAECGGGWILIGIDNAR